VKGDSLAIKRNKYLCEQIGTWYFAEIEKLKMHIPEEYSLLL